MAIIENNPVLNAILYAVLGLGVVKLTTFLLSFGSLFLDVFVLPKTNFAKYGKSTWAVVTGASDGLGKEFAQQLAAKGFNIVLVSRTKSSLEAVAQTLPTQSKVCVIDFADTQTVDSSIDKLVAEIEGLDISILINNVGRSHSIPVPFEETPIAELQDIININCMATLKLTQKLIPKLSTTTRKSLILTVGSFAGLTPTPLLATYSGSKAFLQNWGSALASELVSKNIEVYTVLAYLVTSKMSKVRRSSLTIPTAKAFVTSTLNNFSKRCGAQERVSTSTPYWAHGFMHWGIESFVGVYSKIVAGVNYKMHKSIRARALKKMKRTE